VTVSSEKSCVFNVYGAYADGSSTDSISEARPYHPTYVGLLPAEGSSWPPRAMPNARQAPLRSKPLPMGHIHAECAGAA
jgi:hypothetical protein